MYLKYLNENNDIKMRDKLKDMRHYKVSAQYLSNLKNKSTDSSSNTASSSKDTSNNETSISKSNSPEKETALNAYLQGLIKDGPQMVIDYMTKSEPSWFEKLTKR